MMESNTQVFKVKRPAGLPVERPAELEYTTDIYRLDTLLPYMQAQNENWIRKKTQLLIGDFFGTCDTETTTIDPVAHPELKLPFETPIGFIYLFQFRLCGVNFIFRDHLCFRSFIDRLGKWLDNNHLVLVCYVHNLSFEWQFFKSILDIDRETVFALKNRRIAKFTTNNRTIEWRDSYLLSNMSLEKFTENYCCETYRKDKDLIDYEILRYPWTPLTDEIIYYSLMDVITLEAAVRALLDREHDTLKSIPMTNTGYVRRSYRLACIGENWKKYRTSEEKETYTKFKMYRRMFMKQRLDIQQYELLHNAFRGGNTHANRFYCGTILPEEPGKIGHVDFASSYPAQIICSGEFPMGKLMECTDSMNTPEKITWFSRRYWCVIYAAFEDLELRNPYNTACPYIPVSKINRQKSKDGIYDNGRVISQPGICHYAFLGCEWEIIKKQYTGSIKVIRAYYTPKGYLPNQIRETCHEWYEKKTSLKGIPDKEYEYMKSKNRINATFGMCVEAIIKPIIRVTENLDIKQEEPDEEEAIRQLNEFYEIRNAKFLSYQWGVTITALARVEHMRIIDLIGRDDFIYGDTDSVFYLHPEKHDRSIAEYNEKWIKYIKQCGCPYSAYTKTGEEKILGVAEHEEEVDRFVTLGAKKYALEINGKMELTVAGVPKKAGAKLLGKLENFKPGYQFYVDDDAALADRQSWKKILHYHDNNDITVQIDGHDLRIGTGIGLTRAPYKLDITPEYSALTGFTDIYTEDPEVWQ